MPQPTEDDIRRIYRETIDDLFGFVSRRCDGDRALAEDVTQEAWLRAVRAWSASGMPDRPLSWLATVAARILSNHFRRCRIDSTTGPATAFRMTKRSPMWPTSARSWSEHCLACRGRNGG